MDIGFSTTADANGDYWVSTADIIAFCPSGIGYLTTWYDQSGNGRHATQSSAVLQPAVISGGVIYNINGQPALSINNNQLTFTEFAVGTVIAVTTVDPSAPFLSTLISRVGQDKTIRRTQTTGNGWRSVSGNPTGADLARQPGSYVNGVAASGTSDGGPIIPQVFTTPTITVFNTYFAPTAYAMLSSLFWHTTQAARYFTGKSSEIILMQYTGELSASDRATLTANQATAYGITVAP
jgi:hypothetical protein